MRWLLQILLLFFSTKPFGLSLIVGLCAAFLTTADYELCLKRRIQLAPDVGLVAQSASGVCCLYQKSKKNQQHWWFERCDADGITQIQVPEGAIFTGDLSFSDDGKWFRAKGQIHNKPGGRIFAFDTSTGRLIYDITSDILNNAHKCCFSMDGHLLASIGDQLECWDLSKKQMIAKHPIERNFLTDSLVLSAKHKVLFYIGGFYKEGPFRSDLQLRCWSISENRELWRHHLPSSKGNMAWWSLSIDKSEDYLYGSLISPGMHTNGETYRDGGVINCWNAKDGRLESSISNQGGESYDPVHPMDKDHFLVFHNLKPNLVRQCWQKWFGKEPEWLIKLMPIKSRLDMRDMRTGETLQTMSMGFGHWPRSDTSFGRELATTAFLNKENEVGLWHIEPRNRFADALKTGSLVSVGLWLLLLGLMRLKRALLRKRSL